MICFKMIVFDSVHKYLYLDEDQEGAELGRDIEHEACVDCDPLNANLAAGVHEQRPGAAASRPPPESVVDEVLLIEYRRRVGREGEVVQLLREVVLRERRLRHGVVAIPGRGDELSSVRAACCLTQTLLPPSLLQVQWSDWREWIGVGVCRQCRCGWCM